MMCLSIQQPWAWAILNCGKDVENRSWATGYRGTFLIHVGKKIDTDGIENLLDMGYPVPMSLPTGGIVGVAEIYDCVGEYASKWFFGKWGFLLRNQHSIPFIPCRGQLGFFDVNIEWEGM